MPFRPSDFFIGVLAFFAIILPGALLAFLWQQVPAELIGDHLKIGSDLRWIAFLVAAYVLGQAIYALGSWFLDPVYDWTYEPYKTWKKRKKGEELKTLIKGMMGTLEGRTGTYPWARAYVGVRSSQAAASIERLDADSKFFRSLAIALIIAPYAFVPGHFSLTLTVWAGVLGLIGAIAAYMVGLIRLKAKVPWLESKAWDGFRGCPVARRN
jgi:hypothetical protein